MTQRSDLVRRLHDLQELSKTKKYRLAKQVQEEVLSVLSALVTMDEEGYRITVEALTDFAADVGATLLADNWAYLMETKFPVPQDLGSAKFNTDLRRRLRIALAARLLKADPESALRLLLDVFQEMKPAKKSIPTSKDLGLIRSALIEPAGQFLARLPLQSVMASESNLLTTYVLAATFAHKKPFPTQTQLATIRWANSYPKLGRLPRDVQTAIARAVKTWDTDFRGILAKEIDTLQAALREVLMPVCRTETAEAPPPASQKSSPQSEPMATAQLRPPTPTQQYDALQEIERLGHYLQSLESRLKQSQQKIQTTEHDWQETRNELGVARREREEARRQAEVEHESVRRLLTEKSALQTQIEAFRAEKEKLTQELAAARNHYDETVASYSEQLDTLSERIAREGEHRIETLLNRLGAKVQTYANDLREAIDMEMTVQLGTVLRNQMRQLLRLLKEEGVKIDGGL